MKSSIATSLVILFGAINALPQPELEKRADPDIVPVTLDQFPSTPFKCGTRKYSSQDVHLAAQYGVLLDDTDPPERRGRKTRHYPHGKFPHAFKENKNGVKLDFLPGCPERDGNRSEYPLVKNGPYNGDLKNKKYRNDRVVYRHVKGAKDKDNHPQATFCGVMTHTGASEEGAFVLCTSP